jgi:hypothetical protein
MRLYQWARRLDNAGRLQASLAGLVAFIVYLATLTPSISWGDSPELTAAAYQLGIPHPTGYPVYMLLGHAAMLIVPWGDPAFRLNLLSAVFSAAAVGVGFRLSQRLTDCLVAAWVAALTLTFAPLFWSQAIIAEVYPLASLLSLLLVHQVVCWDQTGKLSHLQLAALVTGLNLAHHLSVSLLAPGLIVFALTSAHARAGLRQLPRLVWLMLLPLVFYLYMPVRARADPWTNWGDTRTLPALLYHISGRFYKTYMFAAPREAVIFRLKELPMGIGLANLGWGGAVLGLAGLVSVIWRPVALLRLIPGGGRRWTPSGDLMLAAWQDWRLAWLFGTWLVLPLIWGVNYHVFDYQVFYMPGLLAATQIAGLGAGAVLRLRAIPAPWSLARTGAAALLIGLAALPGAWRWNENDHHRDWSALRYARGLTQALPPRALVFGMGDNAWFPLFYVLAVERARPDMLVYNMFETTRPESYRLFTRYRSRDFVVLPVRGFGAPGRLQSNYAFLASLVRENIRRRPVAFLMERGWEDDEAREIHAPYFEMRPSNLEFRVYYPIPPQFQATRPGDLDSGIGFADGTRLLYSGITYGEEAGVQWVRLAYRWLVAYKQLADRLEARVWLADRQGRYATGEQNLPRLHHIHQLGYGYLPVVGRGRPVVVNEEFWLWIPEGDAGQTYQVRMQLLRNSVNVPREDSGRLTFLGDVTVPPAPVPVPP